MGRWARRVLGDLVGPDPTDRGKNGVKRSILVEADGGPLSVIVTGANVPDFKLLGATLDAVIIERPEPLEESPQHLCLDKGYDKGEVVEQAVEARGYTPHIRRIGEEKLDSLRARSVTRRGDGWGRANAGLAFEMPGDPGALREEGRQLSGTHPGGFCVLLWYRRQHRLSLLR